MPSERPDAANLLDMLHYAQEVASLVSGQDFASYESDRKLQLAVERGVEIIGEAARGISREFQNRHPEIPWQPIIAQRHILAHEYGEVQADRIWRVATIHLPKLIPLLTPLIPSLPESSKDEDVSKENR
jgi:uncharacterized protein with HEPN domain